MLEELKSVKRAIGIKQTKKAVLNNKCSKCFIADDADPEMVSVLIESCRTADIEVIYAGDMKQLGKACGIDVGASAACILKKGGE